MTLDPRDALLQAHTPAIMVPRFGALPLMQKPGHRFLLTADGMSLEVLRPWLHARVPIGYVEIPLPFGHVEELVQYAFGPQAIAGLQARFLEDAYLAFPNECAAWGVYDERHGTLDYRPLISDHASPGRVEFHRPRLAEHEHLAVDLHSHGALAAFFSATDDADDIGEVKIAVVAGTLNESPTFRSRLCLLGQFIEGNE